MTLRDGLTWLDGKPVTSEDIVPSIKRWGAMVSMGLMLLSFVDTIKAYDT
jgi:peptide/nickel transport system substrate-binding protein